MDQNAQDGSDLRSSPVSINCFYKDVVSDPVLCTVCGMRRRSAGGWITSKFCPSRTHHVFNIENKWIWQTSLNKFLIDSEHESREVKNKESTHDNHFQHQGEVWIWRSSHHIVCRIDRKKHLCYSTIWILFEKSPLLPTSWQCSSQKFASEMSQADGANRLSCVWGVQPEARCVMAPFWEVNWYLMGYPARGARWD